MAAITHLSGLAGYLMPLGGVIVPIIIWVVKSDSPVISSIAKQAVLLNVVFFLLFSALAVLWITIILIPLVILAWIALGIVAIALPILGAWKASDGNLSNAAPRSVPRRGLGDVAAFDLLPVPVFALLQALPLARLYRKS